MSIEKARLQIHDYYDKSLDLATLTSVSHLSSYHFSRLFKEATGDTPMGYVRNFRLEKAVQFLANTNLSVSEIAYFRHVGSYLNTGVNWERHIKRVFEEPRSTKGAAISVCL